MKTTYRKLPIKHGHCFMGPLKLQDAQALLAAVKQRDGVNSKSVLAAPVKVEKQDPVSYFSFRMQFCFGFTPK